MMEGVPVTERNLVDEFRLAFPEIEDQYRKKLNSWGDEHPGNYIVFAFVFKPFLKEELSKSENEEFICRLCSFMERVCISGDLEAINVIWLKVFKLLLSDPKLVKLLWPLLGPTTKANIEDAAGRWGLIRNLPVLARFPAVRFWIKQHLPN